MPYLYLICSVIFVAGETITGGLYNRKNNNESDTSSLYALIKSIATFLFWTVLLLIDFKINANVLWYSLLFAGSFAIYNYAAIRAIKTGPVVLTSLFIQLSLIGTTIWGFFFWNAEFTILVALGLVLVIIAITLCLYNGENKNGKQKISLRWLNYVALSFISNAACSIVQKTQQIEFDGQFGKFLMWVATGIAVIVFIFSYLKRDRTKFKTIIKRSGYIPVISGVMNGFLNYFVILLATSPLSSSLIYPVIGVGGLMITTIFSTVVFKEKMRWWQWIGIFIGMSSVAILSL